MNPLSQFCHNPDCSASGQIGQGNIGVHRVKVVSGVRWMGTAIAVPFRLWLGGVIREHRDEQFRIRAIRFVEKTIPSGVQNQGGESPEAGGTINLTIDCPCASRIPGREEERDG